MAVNNKELLLLTTCLFKTIRIRAAKEIRISRCPYKIEQRAPWQTLLVLARIQGIRLI
jgi:hypothetical protein